MKNEFTAVVERDESWFIAYCPEIPGADGQGRTVDEACRDLAAPVALILEDRRRSAGNRVCRQSGGKVATLEPREASVLRGRKEVDSGD